MTHASATDQQGSALISTSREGQTILQQKSLVATKTYGRGRIVERTKRGSGALYFPPTRPAAVVPAAEAVRYKSWLEDGVLDAHDLQQQQAGQIAWKLLRTCQPAHLLKSGLIGELQSGISLTQLEGLCKSAQVEPLICIGEDNRCMECNWQKNAFGSEYHIREPRCKLLTMPFEEFTRNLRQWNTKGIYFRMPVRQWLPGETDTDFQLRNSSSCPPNVQAVLGEHVNWSWLQDLQKRHRLGAVTEAALEIGGRNTLLPASYSTQDSIIAQVKGVRRVLVISPEHSFKGLYPFPVHHPYDSYSMVDLEQPDLEAWPLCRGVRGKVCDLKPGDLLYIPSCWWVHQQLKEEENIALSFKLAVGYRVRPQPAIALRVSRVVEELIGDMQGPAKIRHWLQILALEEEEGVIDVNTVSGYKQIVAVWEARDEVEAVLGRQAWKQLFPDMCIGRLLPTPWLNKDFKEPLYLTDKPRRIEDKRTEEQRKYPELFRHALPSNWS